MYWSVYENRRQEQFWWPGPIAASATEDEQAKGQMYYNYKTGELMSDEMPGLSVFYKDESGAVFHFYSTYPRGLDMLVGTYHFLDLVPKGRDENPESTMDWVRRHDQYDA